MLKALQTMLAEPALQFAVNPEAARLFELDARAYKAKVQGMSPLSEQLQVTSHTCTRKDTRTYARSCAGHATV